MSENQSADLEKRHKAMKDLKDFHKKETEKKQLEMERLRITHEEFLRDLNAEHKQKAENAKAKYASLFASLDASNKKKPAPTANPLKSKAQKQSPAQSRKRKAADDDAASVIY